MSLLWKPISSEGLCSEPSATGVKLALPKARLSSRGWNWTLSWVRCWGFCRRREGCECWRAWNFRGSSGRKCLRCGSRSGCKIKGATLVVWDWYGEVYWNKLKKRIWVEKGAWNMKLLRSFCSGKNRGVLKKPSLPRANGLLPAKLQKSSRQSPQLLQVEVWMRSGETIASTSKSRSTSHGSCVTKPVSNSSIRHLCENYCGICEKEGNQKIV